MHSATANYETQIEKLHPLQESVSTRPSEDTFGCRSRLEDKDLASITLASPDCFVRDWG